jgi:hypothetical protein
MLKIMFIIFSSLVFLDSSFEDNLDSTCVQHIFSGGDSSVPYLLDALASANPKLAAMYKKRSVCF